LQHIGTEHQILMMRLRGTSDRDGQTCFWVSLHTAWIAKAGSPFRQSFAISWQPRWDEVAARISALPLTDSRSALLRRAIFSAAEDFKPDRQGRILISQRLRDYAQIQNEILIAGVHTFIELWDPGLWNEKVLQQIESGQLDSDLFAALNV
jgi:MraZ protein